jgi:2-oxoisovalerate dehydrogenase E1 component alpha subunit
MTPVSERMLLTRRVRCEGTTMVYTLAPVTAPVDSVEDVARLLSPDGTRLPDRHLDAWVADVDPSALRGLYRDMAVLRRVDAEGVALQRQGQLGLWPPCRGQEATQIGSARAMRREDFAFTSYRELGVFLTRGATPADVVLTWRGETHSSMDPAQVGVAIPQIIIGAQTVHAVGYAMGIQRDGAEAASMAYFGDGAMSEGDVGEAMVFAATFGAPVVFLCTNNQWAISEPVSLQSRIPLSRRAPGYGIPSIRVDGNDVLACLAATRWALDRARTGAGPAFIEAVTYRMGPHTTSDDPTRYRDAAELAFWEQRDPLARVEAHLRSIGEFDDAFRDEVAAAADELCGAVRTACLDARTPAPLTMLDDVYAEPHPALDLQRERLGAYLASFADDEEAGA